VLGDCPVFEAQTDEREDFSLLAGQSSHLGQRREPWGLWLLRHHATL